MRRFLVILFFLCTGAMAFTILPDGHKATCTGASPCKACKNCKYCAHCAKKGGTCGVCKR